MQAFQEFRADLTEIGLEPSERLLGLDQQIARGEVPRSGARRTLRGDELGERLGEARVAGRNMTEDEWQQFGPEGEPSRATCEQWPDLG